LKAKNKTKATWQIFICRKHTHIHTHTHTNTLVFDKNNDAFQQKILYIMNELQTWFQKNYPTMNIEKTVSIFFYCDQFIDFPANHQWFLMTMK
jgi:hypothetical protein